MASAIIIGLEPNSALSPITEISDPRISIENAAKKIKACKIMI
jgi:hypothetical protein